MFSGVGFNGTLMCPLDVKWDIRSDWRLNFLLQKLHVNSVEGGGGEGWEMGGCWTVKGIDSIGLGSTSSVIGFGLNWIVTFGGVSSHPDIGCFFFVWINDVVFGLGAAGTGIIGMWEVCCCCCWGCSVEFGFSVTTIVAGDSSVTSICYGTLLWGAPLLPPPRVP